MIKNTRSFFKNQFRHIIFYSMPEPILFIFRKRLNFIFLMLSFIMLVLYSII